MPEINFPSQDFQVNSPKPGKSILKQKWIWFVFLAIVVIVVLGFVFKGKILNTNNNLNINNNVDTGNKIKISNKLPETYKTQELSEALLSGHGFPAEMMPYAKGQYTFLRAEDTDINATQNQKNAEYLVNDSRENAVRKITESLEKAGWKKTAQESNTEVLMLVAAKGNEQLQVAAYPYSASPDKIQLTFSLIRNK